MVNLLAKQEMSLLANQPKDRILRNAVWVCLFWVFRPTREFFHTNWNVTNAG